MGGRTLIKADLHSHTRFSPDSILSPEEYVRRYVARGFGCVAVTDHNTLDGALAVRAMAPFTVIAGEEIRSADGEILGFFLQEAVPPGLSALETVRAIKAQGGLVALPHPFDRFRRPVRAEALPEILPQVDIVEVFNARTTLQRDNQRARAFAQQHGLAMSAASDAHTPWEVGTVWVEMPQFDGPQSFLAALRQGAIHGRPSAKLVHLFSTVAKLTRRRRP